MHLHVFLEPNAENPSVIGCMDVDGLFAEECIKELFMFANTLT